MKRILILCAIYFISFSCFAAINNASCGHAVPTSDPGFCDSFKSIAYCHCHDEHHMPAPLCSNMTLIYNVMISTYGSLWAACSTKVQQDVSQQECTDDWNFYNSHCK